MQLYRLAASYKALVLILYPVICLQASHQISLQKRNADDLTSTTNDNQAPSLASPSGLGRRAGGHVVAFDSPFIVLMSDDTVSIAQLPMILYGNLTDIYQLSPQELTNIQDIELSDGDQDGGNLEIEQDSGSRGRARATHHESPEPAGADAREYEQMPQMTNVNTTTSLGKSEWQQIAVERRDREEVLLRARKQSVAGNRKDAQGGGVDEEEAKDGGGGGREEEAAGQQRRSVSAARERARRRRRRSNSLSDYDGDSNSASGTSPSEQENHTSAALAAAVATSDAQTSRSATAEESSDMQNVTSARNGADWNQQRQPPLSDQQQQEANLELPTRGGNDGPAEDGDKTGRLPYTSAPLVGAPATTARGLLPLPPPSNRVHFSDLDVHMALGYAFVADSAGRIHRFRLPNGPRSSSPTWSAAGANTLRSNDIGRGGASGSNVSGENVAAGENDATGNAIDVAGGDQGPGNSSSLRESALPDANRDAYDDGYSNRIGATKATTEGGNAGTHEQFGNERQHPTISGGQSASYGTAGAIVSGHNQRATGASFVSGKNLPGDGVESRIIWSRGKFVRRGGAQAEIGRSPATRGEQHEQQQQQQQQRLANSAGRALPAAEARDGAHQMVGGNDDNHDDERVGARETTSGDRHSDEAQLRTSESRRSSCVPRGASNGQRAAAHLLLRTEVAVDWLNNLLFVLDKCRLLVMDLDGNGELVLIDDFNANNRPVEIKVDPVNGFLFWLQLGKFHNTIYKLDLNVLDIPSANHQLVRNAVRLRHSTRTSALTNESSPNFDASDLVPLVSHHYAHPIITNLPKHTRLFTLDHKHSKIYVPLVSPPPPSSPATTSPENDASEASVTSTRDDAEVFAHSGETTHLNSTSFIAINTVANCSQTEGDVASEGQILAYNIDGTDAGPLRSLGLASHINSIDDIQDLTFDTEAGLLYWLTNSGRDLFEEFKENSTIQPAQHYLSGKSYSKLIYFDREHSSQPSDQRPRFNVRKIIDMLSSSISSNRPTRSGERTDGDEPSSLRVLHPDGDTQSGFSRNAPYMVLGVTCLIVTTIYLIYALIFQRIQRQSVQRQSGVNNEGHRGRDGDGASDSISGHSSLGSESHMGDNSNRFVNSTTMKWVAGPSSRNDLGALAFNRNTNSFTEYEVGSSNYATNAIEEHYRDNRVQNPADLHLFDSEASRLANLSSWPTDMHDLSNKQYIPIEFSQDEALNSIRRVSIDQLKIENKEPLGRGHFGKVLQGTIRCTALEKDHLLDRTPHQLTPPATGPISPDSLAPPSRMRLFAPSTVSSGHGSSSSTSCEFATANTLTEPTSNDDYLTPKTQLNSTSSDYSVDMLAGSSRGASYIAYHQDANQAQHSNAPTTPQAEAKLRVAIKMLKEDASRDEKRDFLQEAKLLANFDHPNIVRLIGICLDGGSTFIIMELMLGGDLIRYMQANTPKAGENFDDNLTYDDLLKICLDIANACCYLEDLNYIHRDLAARNCLVSSRKREERVVKLADFGLARDIYKEDYYRQNNDSAMPLKWMALECLLDQKFSTKSDVWSFGIVMWEVMSYCQEKPHAGVEIGFLKPHLKSGGQPKQPEGCDDNMYRLMTRCWRLEPSERPTFHECRAMLIELRNNRRL